MAVRYYLSRLLKDGISRDIDECFIKDIKDNSCITFILADKGNSVNIDLDIKIPSYLDYFKSIGICFKKYNVIYEDTKKEDALKYIEESSVLFLKV